MSDIFYTASSPWQQGTVAWVKSSRIDNSDLMHWARYPLWMDNFPDGGMLPIAAWENLPELLAMKLPTQYHLCDNSVPLQPEIPCRVCVCDRGLSVKNKLVMRWSAIRLYWPALVANAADITCGRFSALRAMCIWLGLDEIGEYAPVYVPEGIDVSGCSTWEEVRGILVADKLRSASVSKTNNFYQQRQANLPWFSRFKRKMRKLRRDPAQFWRDRRTRGLFMK